MPAQQQPVAELRGSASKAPSEDAVCVWNYPRGSLGGFAQAVSLSREEWYWLFAVGNTDALKPRKRSGLSIVQWNKPKV